MKRRYQKRKPYKGVGVKGICIAAILTIMAMLAMTIHANSQWTGVSCGEQIHQALFVAKDWD